MSKAQRLKRERKLRGEIPKDVYQDLKIALLTAQAFEDRVALERARLMTLTGAAMTAAGLDPTCRYALDDATRTAKKQ